MSRKIWQDFGKNLPTKTKTAVEAMIEAKLNWKVISEQIQVIDGNIIPGKLAIIRKDTGKILGVVNSTYKFIQNSVAFSFLDEFVRKGNASYYAAGFIGQGEKIWLLLKLHDSIELSKFDTIQKFILFSNAHDGRGAIRAFFIPIRSKTQTILNISFGKRVEQGIQMRHIGKVEQRIKESNKIFDLAKDFYDNFEKKVLEFYNSNFSQHKVDLLISQCFESYSFDSTRTQNTVKKIRENYEKETKMFPKSVNSAWLWLNSIVDFIDFDRHSKGKDTHERISNHLESLFWGSALRLKQKAWDIVSTLVKL